MSLDVYLHAAEPFPKPQSSGIFVREGGQMKEISEEEWNYRHPDREPIRVVHQPDEETTVLYRGNITHNLGPMATEAGVYTACWRPGELLGPEIALQIREQEKASNYHGAGGVLELEARLPIVHGRDLIKPLWDALRLLVSDRTRFERLNPDNGWGDYEGLIRFVERYLNACINNPDARVEVSR